MPKILILEDDIPTQKVLEMTFVNMSLQVRVAGKLSVARSLLEGERFDLAILDRQLPDGDGVTLLEEIRQRWKGTRVIMLTGRATVDHRVEGLSAGADDYVSKPFDLREVRARVVNLLARTDKRESNFLSAGDLIVDTTLRTVNRAGTVIQLSNREFEVLVYLLQNKGRVVSRTELLERVWKVPKDRDNNSVNVYLSYLRSKLAVPGKPDPIETVLGAGIVIR